MTVINTSVQTLTGLNNIRGNDLSIRRVMERLSSGLRINRGADDPSGLAISKGMTSQIRGVNKAFQNVQDGINMLRTADGGLAEDHDILMRMRDLAVRAANEATLTQEDRAKLQQEMEGLQKEITRIAKTTTFNEKHVLLGSEGQGTWITKQLTFYPGWDLNPKISANGEKISFDRIIGPGNYDAYTINADGSGETIVSNSPVRDSVYGITGDGEIVLFMSNKSGNDELYISNFDGTKEEQVTSLNGSYNIINWEIAADGSKIVFTLEDVVTADTNVFTIDPDGTGFKQVTFSPPGTFPDAYSITDDGNAIYYRRFNLGFAWDIYKVNSDGTGDQYVLNTPTPEGVPVVSGSGNKLVFTRNFDNELVVSNPDGTNQFIVSSGSQLGAIPDITREGEYIVYTKNTGTLYDLFISRTDDSYDKQITFDFGTVDGVNYPKISDDGTKIVFYSDATGNNEIYISELDPSPEYLQAGPDGADHHRIPVWFPYATAAALGVTWVSVETTDGAQRAIDTIDNAIEKVSVERQYLGALEERLAHILDDLSAQSINVSAANSRIEDADMAIEVTNLTKDQIVQQAAQSTLAQANAQPSSVLTWIRANVAKYSTS